MYGPGESPQHPTSSAGGPPGHGAGQQPGHGAGQPHPPQGPPPGSGHQSLPPGAGSGQQGSPSGPGQWQGPPPGSGQQGPPPGSGQQGPPPGSGQQGSPSGPGQWQGPPPGSGQQGYGAQYWGGPGGQATALAQPAYQQAQQAGQQAKASRGGTAAGGRVLVIAAAAVLIVTGGVNAVSGPLGYFSNINIGVLIVGGNPLFLAVAQTVLGVAWLVSGALLLVGRRFPWGLALVSAGVFATYESYFIVRGAVIHYVGLFLAIAVFALLHQDAVRRHCKIGPPAR